jgi:hypothetical protein
MVFANRAVVGERTILLAVQNSPAHTRAVFEVEAVITTQTRVLSWVLD